MNFKIFSLAIVALLLSLSFVTADILPVTFTEVSVPTATHGQDVTIRVNITNTASVNYSQLNWSATTATGATKLPTLSTILGGETKEVSIVLSVPQYTHTSPTLNLRLKNPTHSAASATFSIPIAITPSLKVEKVSDLTRSQNGSVKVTNTGNVDSSVRLSSSNSKIQFAESEFSLPLSTSKTISLSLSDLSTLSIGNNDLTVTATNVNNSTIKSSTTFSLQKTFCSQGSKGNNLSITDIRYETTGNRKKWRPLDKISITVEVRNRGSGAVEDVFLEMGLIDGSGNNVVEDLNFKDSDDTNVDLGSIGRNNEETSTFSFQVPGNMQEGDYKLVFKAYSDDVGEDNLCVDSSSDLESDTFQSIKVEREDEKGKAIAFTTPKFSPAEAVCGDNAVLTVDVYNIGTRDEDRVKVRLFSRDLKIDSSQEIKQGLEIGDSATVMVPFSIPRGVPDKTYDIELTAQYDHRSGEYRENLESSTTLPYKVIGCSPVVSNASNLAFAATLDSEAKAGKDVVVRSAIRNTGSQSVTAVITVKGYESWAELNKISERILTIAPGQSADVSIDLNVNSDASGAKSLILEANTGDRVQTQEIVVPLSKSTAFDWGSLSNNKLAWAIGIINVVLIILIIIVAVKIAQR